jgi:hypothetical protein
LVPDRTPPKIVESANFPNALDDRDVAVKFSKPIDPSSISLGTTGGGSFAFGDNEAQVKSARLDPGDPSTIILATTPLTDGKTYRLTVSDLSDRSGNRLAESTSVSFKYLDAVAPKLTTISAGENANQLVLVFSKPVSEASVVRGGNYTIFALESGGEGAEQRITSGRLDAEDKTGRTVILESARDFVGNQPYRIEAIGGVVDTSVSRTPVALPQKGVDFPYRDVLPPRIRSVSASANKLELAVVFSKPVEVAAAQDISNYAAIGPDHKALDFIPGAAVLDPTGRDVTLRLLPASLHSGIYRLTVQPIADRLGNKPASPLSTTFEFAEADRSALRVLSHSIIAADNQVDNKVTLTFSRAVDPDDATVSSKYSLLAADGSPLDLAVSEARRVPADPTQVTLILSQPLTPGVKVAIKIDGLADIFGQRSTDPIDYAFTPPGIPENASEQVLGWIDRPVLRGNDLTLAIKEEVSRSSAANPNAYVFNSDSARIRSVEKFTVQTDIKSGTRKTLIVLQVDIPTAARHGLTLRVRDLRAEGLDFLGAQKLPAVEVAQP